MSLVGFKAQNHPQQETRDDVDDRAVLPDIFDPLNVRYEFTIDAAASAANAVLPNFWTMEENALVQSWRGQRVWCNPPYSDIEPWVTKAWAEVRGGCPLVVMLLPANRTEQGWWQRHVEPRRDKGRDLDGVSLRVEFLPTRIRFKWPASRVVPPKGDRPPFDCALLIWERGRPARSNSRQMAVK